MVASTLPSARTGLYADPRPDWLALHEETVIDPARPIVDPHHHLWDRGGQRYRRQRVPRRRLDQDVVLGHPRQLAGHRRGVRDAGHDVDLVRVRQRGHPRHGRLQHRLVGSAETVQELRVRGPGQRPEPGSASAGKDH